MNNNELISLRGRTRKGLQTIPNASNYTNRNGLHCLHNCVIMMPYYRRESVSDDRYGRIPNTRRNCEGYQEVRGHRYQATPTRQTARLQSRRIMDREQKGFRQLVSPTEQLRETKGQINKAGTIRHSIIGKLEEADLSLTDSAPEEISLSTHVPFFSIDNLGKSCQVLPKTKKRECVESAFLPMNDNPKYKAIETIHSGFRFRSRLEARWAVFFETLGIEYRYEPEGFELEDGIRYLPDFYLSQKPHWIEIKPNLPSLDEKEKAMRLCLATKTGVTILCGDVWSDVVGINFTPLPEDMRDGLIFDRQTKPHNFIWLSSEECITTGDIDCPPISINLHLGVICRQAAWDECKDCHDAWLISKGTQLHKSLEECNQFQIHIAKSTLLEAFTDARQARF